MLETKEERNIRIKQLLISIIPIGLFIILLLYIVSKYPNLKYKN